MSTNIKFKFNNAGQGSFYTGYFTQEKLSSRFSVVYDCGSLSENKEYIKQSIWKFQTLLLTAHNSTLDLLMISHFDRDHVNEVKTLLQPLRWCATIILPYLYPEERLIIYLDQLAKGAAPDPDYVSFLTNPVEYLNQFRNVGQIIFFNGNDNDDVGVITNDPDQPGGPFFRPNDTNQETPFKGNDEEIKANQLPLDPFPEIKFFRQNFESVFICQDNARYFIDPVWYFYFFNKKGFDKKLTQIFKNKVKKEFPQIDSLGNDVKELKALFDKKGELIKIYKLVFKVPNLNPTSLVVLHGPYTLRAIKGWIRPRERKYRYLADFLGTRKSLSGLATLLTGDLYLKEIVWPAYISGQYHTIGIIQIPHHGSRTKWDCSVLSSTRLKYPIHAVINFGLGNSHGHPTTAVVSEVKAEGWKIQLVHELSRFTYYFQIN